MVHEMCCTELPRSISRLVTVVSLLKLSKWMVDRAASPSPAASADESIDPAAVLRRTTARWLGRVGIVAVGHARAVYSNLAQV